DEWVRGNAIPKYVFSWRAEPAQGGHYTLQLRVRQEDVPEHFVMPVPVKIGFADETMYAYVRIKVTGPLTEAALDLPAEPTRVEFNRSEERRVGKEGKCGWTADREKMRWTESK